VSNEIRLMEWHNPNYAAIVKVRMRNLDAIREHPEDIPLLKAYYRANPAEFINDWGVTFDPRNAEIGLPTLIPFILFPRQREWIDFVIDHWRRQKPGLSEKSRDMGVSWLAMGLSCTLCIFNDGLAIGFGSRKTEYVDKIGTAKPLLPKGRMFMENLPEEFRGGYVPWRDSPFMRITIPETGSIIAGEGGDDIGRGDRASIYFVDEAQPLTAKVMTPQGWKMMADMQIGSFVIGQSGKPTRVKHVNECGVHDVFRVTFGDGTTTECSPNHLWTVDKVWGKRERLTLRAHEIAEKISYRSPGGQTQYRYRIPVCEPVAFDRDDVLPLDPYVVGALLGDGSVKGGVVRLTSADREIIEAVSERLPTGVVLGWFDGRYSHNIIDERGRQGRAIGGEYIRSRARTAVIAAGIAGLGAADKFIPDAYKYASPADRLSLLQGLMDTDGSATGHAASFHTSSPRLAEDVRFIVQSLGGTATHNVKPDSRGYKTMHDVHLMLPGGQVPFRLLRKRAKLGRRQHPPDRTIIAMEHIGRQPVRCITVDADDGLYLTDNFIVTHNSAHLERPELVEASLSQTTNCRIDMSSVKGMANPFAAKRWGGKVDVFIFDWREDPRKSQEWYDKQCDELDPVVVAQEIDRDYSASVKGIVIPGAWVRSAIGAREKLGIAPAGRKGLSFDVADEGEDKNAICESEGIDVLVTDEWSGKGADIFSSTEIVFEMCDEGGYREFRYDADGIGADVRGDSRIINERRKAAGAKPIKAIGYRGSDAVYDPEGIVEGTIGLEGDAGRMNKDYFGNRKAQSWWALRKRFQKTHRWVVGGVACPADEIISLSDKNPKLMALVAELSQATYKTNDAGKIIVQKKTSGTKSPNMADAVVIRYAPMEQEPVEITGEMLAQIARAGAMVRRSY
jgi:hypothetical protein